jgi:hypothetical protein
MTHQNFAIKTLPKLSQPIKRWLADSNLHSWCQIFQQDLNTFDQKPFNVHKFPKILSTIYNSSLTPILKTTRKCSFIKVKTIFELRKKKLQNRRKRKEHMKTSPPVLHMQTFLLRHRKCLERVFIKTSSNLYQFFLRIKPALYGSHKPKAESKKILLSSSPKALGVWRAR